VRSPSARALDNTIDIYAALDTPASEGIGGPVWNYPPTPTYARVPCTAQPVEYEEITDAQERVTQVVHWKLIFASQQMIDPKDKFIFVDKSGVSHTLFVNAQRDNASRGAAFTVKAVERI
jgi:hypothetical protein